MSRTLSMNSGSLDSLNVLTRCGRKLNARQIRLTAVWLSPHRRASVRVLQCVASRGVVSSVTRITRSTSSSVIRRGAPGRGSSSSPSRRWPRNRVRHLPMVCLVSRSSRATPVFVLPAAHSSTNRARSARARAVAQPALLVDTGAGSGVPGIPLFGTGSTTCSPQPGCASNFQYLAGQFTLANGATLDSVQGWMSVAGAMSMVVRIYADNSGVPGTSIFSKTYTLDFSPTAWVIFAGFNPVLAAGTYWLAFEPANGSNFQAAMPTDAPNPLPNYAFYVNGNIRYINFGLFGPQPGFGVRVSGTTSTTSPTFPSGTFTQVTQFTNCCNPVVVVDNVDVISGDVGRPKTV